ncbi:hypothetical protein WJX72_003794 [[Myrmecia] bisecta]|uniref:CSD domain-containing protein n=1 Tax=[Myrmecia] bisecta TaxID=41462 RepID=A0AAW1PID8_9CHLO
MRATCKRRYRPSREIEQVKVAGQVEVSRQGAVVTVRDSFGFISCPDFPQQVFFHGSELQRDEGAATEGGDLTTSISPGATVEFVVAPPSSRSNKLVAKQVRQIAAAAPPVRQPSGGAAERARPPRPDRYTGTVETNLRGGFRRKEEAYGGRISWQPPAGEEGQAAEPESLPFEGTDLAQAGASLQVGDRVEFNITTAPRAGGWHTTEASASGRRATKVRLVSRATGAEAGTSGGEERGQGFVAGIQGQTGCIRCTDREGWLHFSLGKSSPPQFSVQDEVSFAVGQDPNGGAVLATDVQSLPPGTITAEQRIQGVVQATVIKPVSATSRGEPLPGTVSYVDAEGSEQRAAYLQVEGGEAGSLGMEDEVECELWLNTKTSRQYARAVRLVTKGAPRRELGKVSLLKNNFGFIMCCERQGDMFFHFSAVQGLAPGALQEGLDVDFVVAKEPGSGRPIAVQVRKASERAAVFETVSEEVFEGCVVQALVLHKGFPGAGCGCGLIGYTQMDGTPSKLIFTSKDLQDGRLNPAVGDAISFRITTDLKSARAAEKVGGKASKYAGRRATQVCPAPKRGMVHSVKAGYGFIDASQQPARRLFFHATEVEGGVALQRGDEVEFVIAEQTGSRDPMARKIKRIREAAAARQEEPV